MHIHLLTQNLQYQLFQEAQCVIQLNGAPTLSQPNLAIQVGTFTCHLTSYLSLSNVV